MSKQGWLACLLTACFLTVLAGCAPAPTPVRGGPAAQPQGEKLSATVLHNTLQCGDGREPTAIWIDDPQQLDQRYRQISRSAAETATPPVLDFSREGVLLIGMGQRPTGGYLLNYQEQPIYFDGGVLDVEVSWQEPLPGYTQAQVTTTPCLLLKLPAIADLKRVRVWDQNRELKLDTAG